MIMFLHHKAFFVLVSLLFSSAVLTSVTLAKPDITQLYNDRIDVAFQARYECLGEDIWVTGVMHVVTVTSEDENSMLVSQHVNSHFTGVGVTTGNEYVVDEINNTSQKYDLN